MAGSEHSSIALVAVDEMVLEQLVQAATDGACADEMTPPLSAGGVWTPIRVTWLRTFHRDRRAGLSGPAGEATWAVVAGERVVGSVRLKRSAEQGVLETGAWLTRSGRGRGAGRAALASVLQQAAALGAQVVCAQTTTGNASALAVLRRLGFELVPGHEVHGVRARLPLTLPATTASAVEVADLHGEGWA